MVMVVGFAFDYECEHVLLVEKIHPSWQAGKLNGIGGKVESGEQVRQAMAREFREETCGRLVGSHLYRPDGWQHAVSLTGDDWQCAIFHGRLSRTDMLARHQQYNDEQERLTVVSLPELYTRFVVPNIRWLIPFCLSTAEYHANHIPLVMTEAYAGAVIESAKRAKQKKTA